MAFDDVTFFELHLDGAQFGPTSGDDAETDYERPTARRVDDEDESGGRGGLVLKLAAVAVVLGAVALAVRRYRSDDQTTVDDFSEERAGSESMELDDVGA